MKRVTILGATGSIGTQTLDVISQNSDDFEVVALTASESVEKMAELIQRFCPSYAVMKNEEKAEELRKLLPNHSCEILYGAGNEFPLTPDVQSAFVCRSMSIHP